MIETLLKRMLVQDFNYFSIMFYYIISTIYQEIGDLFCHVHISGLSHSVSKVGKRAAHARLNQALVLTESSLEKHSE